MVVSTRSRDAQCRQKLEGIVWIVFSTASRLIRLKDSRKRVPRFLFRTFTSYSGGDERLNTPNQIAPHAFLPKRPNHKTIYEIPEGRRVIDSHLMGQRQTPGTPYSEFSSWTDSLLIVLSIAQCRANLMLVSYVAVVDTFKLPKDVAIYHTPALYEVGLACCRHSYEYLAHGVIKGEALRCVPFQSILDVGLLSALPNLSNMCCDWGYAYRRELHGNGHHIKTLDNVDDLRVAKRIGMLFSCDGTPDDLCLYVTITFHCLHKRWSDECPLTPYPPGFEQLWAALHRDPDRMLVSANLGQDPTTSGYPEILHTMGLLQFLVSESRRLQNPGSSSVVTTS